MQSVPLRFCRHILGWLALASLFVLWPEPGDHAAGQTTPPTPSSQRARAGEAEVLFNEGLAQFYEGEFGAAEKHFRAALDQDPRDVDARHYVGLCLSNRGYPRAAVEAFDQVLALDNRHGPARLARVGALIRGKWYDTAAADIATLERNPALRAAAMNLRGQLHYAQGHYADAAQAFREARAAGAPDAAEAGLMEGLALYRAGQREESRAALERAAQLDFDSSLASASRQLEAALSAQRGARPLEFELSAGYEYDSNVVLFDEGVTLPDNISGQDDGRFVLEPRLRWNAVRTDRLTAGLSTSNYFSFQSELTDYDVSSYQVGPFVNYRLSDHLVAGLRYDVNWVEVGHEHYLARDVVTSELTLYEPGFGYTGLFYQYDARQYQPIAGEGALNRDGRVATVGLIQSIELPELFQGRGPAEVQLSGRLRDQVSRGADFDGVLYDLGAVLLIPMPCDLTADVGVQYGWENYDNPNSLDFERDRRRDTELIFSAGLTRRVNDWLSIRAEYLYTDHDSNVETSDGVQPYEFSSHVVGLRMLITF